MLLNLLSQLRKSARRRLPKDLHSQVKKEYAGAVRDAREMGITSFMHRIGLCKVREILRSKDELKYGKDENGYDFVSIFYEGILLKSINRGGSSILSQADGVEKPIGEVDFTLQREDTFKELSFAKMFSRLFTKQPLQILIVGLPGFGKTTILSKLLGESVTTIGETVQLKNIIFTTWCEDKTSGGNTMGVIYVVDSGDHGALVVARENLHKLLNELKNVHLLVFANKQDLPNAMDAVEITHKLGLHSLPQQNWYILGTCANSEEGFYEGADWLSNNIANKEPQVSDSWFRDNRPVLKSLFESAYGKGGKRALPITPGDPLTKGLERIKEFYDMEGIIETGVDQNGDGFAQLSFSKWVLRNLIRKGKAKSHFTVSVGRSTYDICSAN